MSEASTTGTGSAQASEDLKDLGALRAKKPRSLWSDAFRQFRHHKLAMAGSIVILVFILMVIFGPMIYSGPVRGIDFSIAYENPSLQYPMGTTHEGHDVFARIMWGGRISIAVGFAAMLVGIAIGTTVGAVSGYFGGLTDSILMRFTDLAISLPVLPLLLLIIYLFRDTMRDAFGSLLGNFILIVVVIGALAWMPVARLVRASFLSIKEKEYVEAAHCIGAKTSSIMLRHIMPNVMSPIIVAATLAVAQAIITESTLSFLGLGFPPDIPTWGRMLFDARDYMAIHPWMVIFPGSAIFLTVLSINYVGDGLRDALDPHRTV
jgi:peptide/nickel transport system permease protein